MAALAVEQANDTMHLSLTAFVRAWCLRCSLRFHHAYIAEMLLLSTASGYHLLPPATLLGAGAIRCRLRPLRQWLCRPGPAVTALPSRDSTILLVFQLPEITRLRPFADSFHLPQNMTAVPVEKYVCGEGDDCPCYHAEQTRPPPKPVALAALQITLAPGETYWACACGMSATFPACDGTHDKVNAETGSTFAPIAVSNTESVPKDFFLCQCGHSKTRPLCDGSHEKVHVVGSR